MTREQEFEEFALARTPHLHRAAGLLCEDTHRAEALVQEALAKVYTRWTPRLGKPIDNPAAYAQIVVLARVLATLEEEDGGQARQRPTVTPTAARRNTPVAS